MKQIFSIFLIFFLFPIYSLAQLELAFQGGEVGDSWSYTSTGADATALAEALLNPNKKTGTQSLVVGGNTAGGSCMDGGSGNGPATPRTFAFDPLDISTSNTFVRTLSFSWGNRYPVCVGTGWDSGEDLYFTPIHDGTTQTPILIVEGNANAAYSILENEFTYEIPTCVSQFSFELSITTNRRDELLFLDNVRLTTPELNDLNALPVVNSLLSPPIDLCENQQTTYSVFPENGISYTWSGLPSTASFTSENGTQNAATIQVNWGTTIPGTYTLTVSPTINQCNSTVQGNSFSFNVTILPSNATSFSLELCNGEQYDFHGQIITSAGSYETTLQNVNGCDSIITANISFINSFTSTSSVNICEGESYSFNGVNYSSSQTLVGNFQSLQGCDSIVTVELVVNPNFIQTNQITICENESYLFEGQSYSQTGIYEVTYQNVGGCDSILHLDLTVIPQSQTQVEFTLCENDTIYLNGSAYTEAGTYTLDFTSINGCDSVVTYVISVSQMQTVEKDTFVCNEFSFNWNGQVINEIGTYSSVLQGSNSCDSISILHVFLKPSSIAQFSYVLNESSTGSYELILTNESTLADTYWWEFGDNNGSSDLSPSHSYGLGIEFPLNVILFASSDSTCTDSLSIQISPTLEDIIYVPNSFTPDGNEFNQVFKPIVSGNIDFNKYRLEIFNRWGNLIFVSNDPSIGWDGTGMESGLTKSECYTWKVTYKLANNDDMKVFQGHVNLLK